MAADTVRLYHIIKEFAMGENEKTGENRMGAKMAADTVRLYHKILKKQWWIKNGDTESTIGGRFSYRADHPNLSECRKLCSVHNTAESTVHLQR